MVGYHIEAVESVDPEPYDKCYGAVKACFEDEWNLVEDHIPGDTAAYCRDERDGKDTGEVVVMFNGDKCTGNAERDQPYRVAEDKERFVLDRGSVMKTKEDHKDHDRNDHDRRQVTAKRIRGLADDHIAGNPTAEGRKEGRDEDTEQIEFVPHCDEEAAHCESNDPYILSCLEHLTPLL